MKMRTPEELRHWHTCEEWENCIPPMVKLMEVRYEARRGKFVSSAVAWDRKDRVIKYDHDGKSRLFWDKVKGRFFRHEDSEEEGFDIKDLSLMEYRHSERLDIKWE